MDLKVNRFVDKTLKPRFYILGFPVVMLDVETTTVHFLKNILYVDSDLRLLKESKYSGTSDLVINSIIDYNLEIETRFYHGYLDIMSKLGGLSAIFSPIL